MMHERTVEDMREDMESSPTTMYCVAARSLIKWRRIRVQMGGGSKQPALQ